MSCDVGRQEIFHYHYACLRSCCFHFCFAACYHFLYTCYFSVSNFAIIFGSHSFGNRRVPSLSTRSPNCRSNLASRSSTAMTDSTKLAIVLSSAMCGTRTELVVIAAIVSCSLVIYSC